MVFTVVEYRLHLGNLHLPYNKVGANNNRNKNQNWIVFRIEVSGANTNNRNSVA